MILRRVWYMLIAIFTCTTLLFGGSQTAAAQSTAAQAGDSFTFKNGHTVSGAFFTFYKSVGVAEDDPDRIFGLPITVVFDDPLPSGKKIQYFERARMELDPVTNQVSLAKLGEFAYDPAQPGLPAPIQPNDPQCQTFSNGKLACYAFREFYERYGEKYFGLPVTNALFTVEGRLVQYFQNARMEWRGEMPASKRVVISALGQFDFDKRIGDQSLRRPRPVNIPGSGSVTAPAVIPSLHAFAGKPLVANGDRQQIFALLHDQYGEAVKGAPVTVTFYNSDDKTNVRSLSNIPGISGITTDENGIAIAEFEVGKALPNQVVLVVVEAQVNDAKLTVTTWYRVWW